jgi:hypothetical protein
MFQTSYKKFVTHVVDYLEILRRDQNLLPNHKEICLSAQEKIVSTQREVLYSYVVNAYADPLAGCILRRTTTRHIAKSILWFLYPSYELGDTVADKLFKELDMKIFPNEEEEGGGIKRDDDVKM